MLLQRRLLLGAVGIAGVAAFGLIPTQQLQIAKPNKPLFFYIVPLLRYGPRDGLPGGWRSALNEWFTAALLYVSGCSVLSRP